MTFAAEALLLSVPFLCHGMGINLYVKPTTPDTPRPADFCLTLSEYASGIFDYDYNTNITMLLLPGHHILVHPVVDMVQ